MHKDHLRYDVMLNMTVFFLIIRIKSDVLLKILCSTTKNNWSVCRVFWSCLLATRGQHYSRINVHHRDTLDWPKVTHASETSSLWFSHTAQGPFSSKEYSTLLSECVL